MEHLVRLAALRRVVGHGALSWGIAATLLPLFGAEDAETSRRKTEERPELESAETFQIRSLQWRPKYHFFFTEGSESVVDTATNQALIRTTGAPNQNEYRVAPVAKFLFSERDRGRKVRVHYKYRPRKIAILLPHNRTGLRDPPSYLRSRLLLAFREHGYLVVGDDEMNRVLRDLRFYPAADVPPKQLQTICQHLQADEVVTAEVSDVERRETRTVIIIEDDSSADVSMPEILGVRVRVAVHDKEGAILWQSSGQNVGQVGFRTHRYARRKRIDHALGSLLREYFGEE